jgi:hypothetical protein|tara:strand:+ start:1501 stop:1710 length:210 start_codon:yes stop_codon:yes gene_type:complete
MNLVDKIQEKKIKILFYLVGTVGAIATFSVFLRNRKHIEKDDAIRNMELEIKKLELSKLLNEKKLKSTQ